MEGDSRVMPASGRSDGRLFLEYIPLCFVIYFLVLCFRLDD